MKDRIPALVVSGFLGSGKTTLVRHLLDEAQRNGQRVAVVSFVSLYHDSNIAI